MRNDIYHLYDLHVIVEASGDGRPMVCKHPAGLAFTITEDDLITFAPGVRFPMYPLAAILPLLSAKQRELEKADWMYTDSVIACPDPNCGGRFRISRGDRREYRHGDHTVTPLAD